MALTVGVLERGMLNAGPERIEQGYWLGAYLTLLDSASLSPSISSADFDLETLDKELGAWLEALGLPVKLEAELVKA